MKRIEGALDCSHRFYGGCTKFPGEIRHLSLPDPMLAGAGPSHVERSHHQPVEKRAYPSKLRGALHVHDRQHVEIPIAHMSHDGSGQSRGLDVGNRLQDTARQL